MKKRSLINTIIYTLNAIAAILLLMAYLLPFIPPKSAAILSVLSLSVPLLIAINFIFVIYWTIKMKKQVFLSLVILVIGFNYLGSLYQFSVEKDITTNNELSVLSYNVRLFNQYNSIEDKGIPKKIEAIVNDANADVVSFQEYYITSKVDFSEYKYSYVECKKRTSRIGQAIFSKYKIINKGSLDFPDTGNNAIYVDIIKGKDTIRVYNLHLESLHINPDVNELTEQDSEKLAKRIGNTFKMQQFQMELFEKHRTTCKYKTIVCGDLNNTAFSYVYKKIKGEELVDAFEEAGSGFGRTFDFKFFPMRIDFILVDQSFEVNAFKSYDQEYSDHFPIYTRITL